MQKNYNVLSRSGFSTTATAIVPMTYYISLLHSFSFVFLFISITFVEWMTTAFSRCRLSAGPATVFIPFL